MPSAVGWGGANTRSLYLRKTVCYCKRMVGYRESRFSFNDPMDEWENKMVRNAKPSSGRVLKGGYAGLLRSIFTGGKPAPDNDPRSLNFWKTVPMYPDEDYAPRSSRFKPKK